jgi:hypothetical protein
MHSVLPLSNRHADADCGTSRVEGAEQSPPKQVPPARQQSLSTLIHLVYAQIAPAKKDNMIMSAD